MSRSTNSTASWIKSLPIAVLIAALGAAVAWGATDSTVKETAKKVEALEKRELDRVEQMGRMESKIDLIYQSVQRMEQHTH